MTCGNMKGTSSMKSNSQGSGLTNLINHVAFVIDGSGSMSGSRWKQVRRAINMFIDNLSDKDMISTIIFND